MGANEDYQKISGFRSLFSVKSMILQVLRNFFLFTAILGLLHRIGNVEIGDLHSYVFFGTISLIIFSAFLTLMDAWKRKRDVKIPVLKILKATEEVTAGNLDAKIEPFHDDTPQNEFDLIADNFNIMMKELRGMETLRTDFISNVSHEMKTPLSNISNYATLMQMPDISEEKRIEYARQVAESARRMSSMITNILKLNKLENQAIFPEQTEFNLSEQLVQSILHYESAWEDKNIEMDADIPDQITCRSDEELLGLVWNNLLSNAVKFTPEGGRIQVQLRQIDAGLQVVVADNGCGMDEETCSHIFEKFYQGDTSHATHGNGLGLALVKRIIDILHGTITVDSAPGKGSRFTITLPLQPQK